MKRVISLILIFSIYSYASLIGSAYSQRDLQILEDLDINPSFISDYKLQKVYTQYQSKYNSSNYVEKLNEASLFVPKIKEILREEGIPDVFIYMAMAESNFTMDAKSRVRATGLWQFMSATGKRYGLENDLYVDERMDLIKSTKAAADYLNRLHDIFGKWYLAAIAYNCGEGRVIEAIARATIDLYVERNPHMKNDKQIDEYRNIIKAYQEKRVKFREVRKVYNEVKKWNIEPDINDLLTVQTKISRQYIPSESRRYIRKIISLAMMKSQSFIRHEENSHLLNMGISTTVATVQVKGGLHLRNIANSIGMSYDELLSLNKHIKQSIIPPTKEVYEINIPYSRLSRFNETKDSIKDTKFVVHIVKRGDTLYGLSRKYRIPYSLIKDYNKLKTNKLALKQKIILPIPKDMIGKIKFSNDNSYTSNKKNYTVKSGDSLYSIAKKYKINVEKLKRDNNLKTSLLKIGDKIVIR
ncbi:lytic transglycosylase domain-containing protein [Halarcobacter bivalviorum]|uniref:Membrane-bound lytic murein transglycosylase D n=1 Tax=Halarcobacter bivalviorum TaxID=663364 RepID=A0AAX2ACW3_9BACT|nr:lytic transglycosylase domain-containing protein [Halarcobacter bivalviorum]AXH12506.1 membrane-bound lytic murein transglycosylase D [Halarcobacter bivalviorum]RXK10571.1 hypothetical protein CRV05_04635 [Halarcobacter bivalviorum]